MASKHVVANIISEAKYSLSSDMYDIFIEDIINTADARLAFLKKVDANRTNPK